MHHIQQKVIAGYNALIDEQRSLTGNATTTLVQFGHLAELIFNNIHLGDLPRLGKGNYVPYGATALLDGVGLIIDTIAERFDQAPGPSNVLIAILSDGGENNSDKYTLEQIRKEITFRRLEDDWVFIYLAAGDAAAAYAARLLIPKDHIFNFLAEDVQTLLLKFSKAVTQFRLGNENYLQLMQ